VAVANLQDFRKWKFHLEIGERNINNLLEIANNKKITDDLTNHFPQPYTRAAGEAFINMTETTDSHIAIDLAGKAIGAIGLHPQSDIFEKN